MVRDFCRKENRFEHWLFLSGLIVNDALLLGTELDLFRAKSPWNLLEHVNNHRSLIAVVLEDVKSMKFLDL